MAALNPHQFGEIPPPMGETPIPEGMVRFHHYTSEAGAEGIAKHGLLQRYAEESFERGGTEAPINFATVGVAKDERLRQAPHVEGWADPTPRTGNLDIGENWREDAEHATRLEKSQNTITFRGDVPASQIVAVHHPWHTHYRYMMQDERLKQEVIEGQHDNLADPKHAFYDANYAKAIAAVKAHGVSNLNPHQFGGDDAPLRWTRSAMTLSWSPPRDAPDKDWDDESKSGYADFCMDCGFPEADRKRKAGLDVHTTYHDNFDHACEGPDCGIDPVKAEREWKNQDDW